MTTHRPLFELLHSSDVSKRTVASVSAWPDKRLFKLLEALRGLPPHEFHRGSGPFNFVANDSLSGRAVPFSTGDTRLARATQLSRFAALYADTLLLRDPLEVYPTASFAQDEHGALREIGRDLEPKDFANPRLRQHFVDDLRLMLALKPLFEDGLLAFSRTALHYCPSCIRALADRAELHMWLDTPSEVAWQERVAKAVKHIENAFLKQGRTFVHQHGDHAHAVVHLPPDLFEYDQMQLELPEALPPRLAKRAQEPVLISLRDVRSLRVLSQEIDRIIDDISTQNAAANLFGAHYLTDRTIDLQLMNLVSDKPARTFNLAAADALTHPLAFVDNVPLDRLLKLRKAEGEAFAVYRDSVRKLLANSNGKTAKELQETFEDEIQPELNRIDLAIRNSRKIVSTSTLTDAVVVLASVSVAMFSGLLPPQLGIPPHILDVGAALGGWQGLKGLAAKLPGLRATPREVSDNKYAFLWKVRSQVRRGRG